MSTDREVAALQPLQSTIAWLEVAGVLLIAPLLLLPGRIIGLAWHPLLIGLLLLLRIVHMVVLKRWVTTPLDIATWVVAASLSLGLWVSVDKTTSWAVAGYIVLGIALYFALVNWPPAQRMPVLDFILLMLAASALLLVGIGATGETANVLLDAAAPFSQLGLPAALSALSARFGEVVNVNILLSLAVFLWPFMLALTLVWRWDRFWWTPLLGVAGCLFLAYLMFVGRSRGTILALLPAMVVVLVVRWPRLLYAAVAGGPLLLRGRDQDTDARAYSGGALSHALDWRSLRSPRNLAARRGGLGRLRLHRHWHRPL